MNENGIDGGIGTHVRDNRQQKPTCPEAQRPQDKAKHSGQTSAQKARRISVNVTQTK